MRIILNTKTRVIDDAEHTYYLGKKEKKTCKNITIYFLEPDKKDLKKTTVVLFRRATVEGNNYLCICSL